MLVSAACKWWQGYLSKTAGLVLASPAGRFGFSHTLFFFSNQTSIEHPSITNLMVFKTDVENKLCKMRYTKWPNINVIGTLIKTA
jgi:hypothetical protein